MCLLSSKGLAAAKGHSVTFGKPFTVHWLVGTEEDQAVSLSIRPMVVDGQMKAYTLGPAHDINEHLFAVMRVFRLNDRLPEDKGTQPKWRWQRGGWLLIDRTSGKVSPVFMPEFDSYFSVASWYRDYVAYCGISDDADKVLNIVMQLGRKKPILRKMAGKAGPAVMPDSICGAPVWQRQPPRVTFQTLGEPGITYQVRGHAADMVRDEEEEAGAR